MKKVLLSSAIAAAMGVSGFAQAAVDFREDASDRDVNIYASELTIGTSGLTLGASNDELDVITELGFGVAADQRRFIRLDLAGGEATFETAPTVSVTQPVTVAGVPLVDGNGDTIFANAADLGTNTQATGSATALGVVATGVASQGGDGENFYIVEVTAPTAGTTIPTGDLSDLSVDLDASNYVKDDGSGNPVAIVGDVSIDPTFSLTTETGTTTAGLDQDAVVKVVGADLTVESAESVSLTYTLYETAVDAAANDGNDLATEAGIIAGFQSALVAIAGPVDNAKKIDVTEESLLFEDNSGTPNTEVSPFGELIISLADADSDASGVQTFVRDETGAVITALNELLDPANTTAVVSGDFSSAVSLANDGTQIAIADLLNDDGDAVFEVSAADLAGSAKSYTFQYQTDGETAIPEAQFQVTANLDSMSGFTLPESIGPVNLNQFEKNGSTTTENMTLDPNGAFKNFVRISNTSGVEGRVFVTIINDDGESESFALSDVTVGSAAQPATLTAQASTRLIPMSAFVAAAQAQNPDFGTAESSRNKFRLVIDGEFPTITSDNVTLATDNTTFSTF